MCTIAPPVPPCDVPCPGTPFVDARTTTLLTFPAPEAAPVKTSERRRGECVVTRATPFVDGGLVMPEPEVTTHDLEKDREQPRNRLFTVGAVVAMSVALTVLLATVIKPLRPWWMNDFAVYHAAGEAVLNGLSMYDVKAHAGIVADSQFAYPTFAALLIVPFSLFDRAVAEVLWNFTTAVLLGAILWMSFGMAGVMNRKARMTLVVTAMLPCYFLLDPVLVNFDLGQINMVVVALVLTDFSRSLPDRWRGFAIGVAAGIKLTPLIFVIYLVCIGRGRDALRAVAGMLLTIAIAFAVLPGDSRRYWFGGLFASSERLVSDFPALVNHSLSGLFSRLSGTSAVPGWAPFVTVPVGLLGLAAAVWAARRGQAMVGMLVVGFTALLVSPVTWPHHAIWLVPALAWLTFAAWRTGTLLPRAIAVAVVAHSALALYDPVQRMEGDVALQTTPSGNLVASLGGLLGMIVLGLVTLPVWLRRLERPQPSFDGRGFLSSSRTIGSP
ncbi:glycosyltransferase 87 family protein [Amycolatopsis sp. QT-25]|uniref:glycosyltransferase 87 family protein n=1 Tax=Amycolatopsis sp. QT-25 TaxID=3034022 RepID=UPI0023EDE428|nr:glycosyltransferase 87 family protein [Amycolatopsis sp. QT-25]WET82512.1 glycosyltransferase 87 family protein [Amycolatopsis sp. QT-25]